MRYDLYCVLHVFAYFTTRTIWATLSKDSSICRPLKVFCEGKASNFKCYQVLKIFKSCTWISGMPFFLKNISFSIFDQFLMHQKKFSGFFAIAEYVISRHISRCTFRIYIVLYDYKLFLTSYVGLKIRINVKFLHFFCFFHFQPPQRRSKTNL